MTKEQARDLFIDYMYDELDSDLKNQLEAMLDQHPDLKAELDGLTETRQVLAHLPVQEPKEQFVMMEPDQSESTSTNWWAGILDFVKPQSGFGRFGVAMASFAFLFLALGSLTDMNMSFKEGNFELSFGEQTNAPQGYSAAQVEMLINQVRQENAELVSQMVLAAQEEQELQFQETLANFADYLDDQRSSDMEMIDYSLTNFQETTYNRFVQTDAVLSEIIQTVSTN